MSAEPLRGLHILVVDDDAIARRVVTGLLEHCGALVTATDSAESAWLSLARIIPEVIVCAVGLGGGRDAYMLLHRVRTSGSPAAVRVPAVAILRAQDPRTLNDVLEAGFTGYVKAPFEPRQLCGVIADVADAHPRERRPD